MWYCSLYALLFFTMISRWPSRSSPHCTHRPALSRLRYTARRYAPRSLIWFPSTMPAGTSRMAASTCGMKSPVASRWQKSRGFVTGGRLHWVPGRGVPVAVGAAVAAAGGGSAIGGEDADGLSSPQVEHNIPSAIRAGTFTIAIRMASPDLDVEGHLRAHAVDHRVDLRDAAPAREDAILELVAADDVLEEVAVLEVPA